MTEENSHNKKTELPRNMKVFFIGFAVFAVLLVTVMVLIATGAFKENIQRGNTIGNNGNFGVAVNTGDAIYYSKSGIWRYHADTSDDKISEDEAFYLNYHDEWIYYSNLSDKGRLYRVRTDGNGREALSDMRTESIDIVNGTVYYATTVLGGEQTTQKIGIYKISPEGTSVQILAVNAEHISVLDENIYFVDKDSGYRLCRVKNDGTDLKFITDEFIHSYDIADDWVYCAGLNSIYKMRKDGSAQTLLSNSGATSIIIVGDSMYYNYHNLMEQDTSASSAFMSMKTDGTGAKKLLNTGLLAVNTFDSNTLLCAPYTATPVLYRFDIAAGTFNEMTRD